MKLRPHCHTAIFTAPTFVSAGTISASTQNVTPGLPAGATTGDILVYIVCNNSSLSSGPSGYSFLAIGNGAITELRVYWKRHSGSESAQTASINPSSTGLIARMLAFRGCVAAGVPFDQSTSSVDNTNATSLTFPAVTSTLPNTMVLNVIGEALSTATGTAEFSAYANAVLASITEATDNNSTSGNGEGIGSAYGVLATPGSSGTTTVTAATAKNHQFITCNLLGVST